MPLDNPRGGYGLSAEYQSSALPWVTSSVAPTTPQEIDFNYITRFICVNNTDSASSLSIGFSLNGINGGNRLIIPHGQALTLEWRCAKLWIKGESGGNPNYSLAVGLTTVPAGQMPILSGSGPDGSNWQGVG